LTGGTGLVLCHRGNAEIDGMALASGDCLLVSDTNADRGASPGKALLFQITIAAI